MNFILFLVVTGVVGLTFFSLVMRYDHMHKYDW